MKYVFLSVLILFGSVARAETFTCSYPAYSGESVIILKIKIEGKIAKVDQEEYDVLKNTERGIVLARGFAKARVGLDGLVIDKKTLTYTRGSIVAEKKTGDIATGSCIKD